MGERLAGGNDAIALLGNTLATGAGLVVLITIFGPISGAHFNPAVTLAFAMRREIALAAAPAPTSPSRSSAAIVGVWVAHAMFAEPILQVSTKLRDGPSQALRRVRRDLRPDRRRSWARCGFGPTRRRWIVGLYITSAYWFTASTSFANPAVTIARSLSNTFAGIAPSSAPASSPRSSRAQWRPAWLFGWLLNGSEARVGPGVS